MNWLGLILNFGMAFVLTPLILKKLGATGFGLWALIQSLSGYYGLINLGLNSALQQGVSRAVAQRDGAALQELVGTSVMFLSITGGAILIGVLFGWRGLAHAFEIPQGMSGMFRLAVILCAVSVVTDFFGAVLSTLVSAQERYDIITIQSFLRQLFQSILLLGVLSKTPSVASMAVCIAITSVGALLINTAVAKRLYPALALSWRGASRTRLSSLMRFGSAMILLRISGIVRLRVGSIILVKTSGLAAVAQYSVAANLIQNLTSVMDATVKVLTPRFARLDAVNDEFELSRLYKIALFVAASLASGFSLLGFVFAERFIQLWLGSGAEGASDVLRVLLIGYAVALSQSPVWNIMLAKGKHHFMAWVALGEAIVILGLGLWLAGLYGPIGFAWATSGVMIATKVFIQSVYGAKLGQLKYLEFWAPMAGPLIISTALAFVMHQAGLEVWLSQGAWIELIGAGLGVGLAYCTCVVVSGSRSAFFPTSLFTSSLTFLKRLRRRSSQS